MDYECRLICDRLEKLDGSMERLRKSIASLEGCWMYLDGRIDPNSEKRITEAKSLGLERYIPANVQRFRKEYDYLSLVVDCSVYELAEKSKVNGREFLMSNLTGDFRMDISFSRPEGFDAARLEDALLDYHKDGVYMYGAKVKDVKVSEEGGLLKAALDLPIHNNLRYLRLNLSLLQQAEVRLEQVLHKALATLPREIN